MTEGEAFFLLVTALFFFSKHATSIIFSSSFGISASQGLFSGVEVARTDPGCLVLVINLHGKTQ
jgi:hypothetical protein